MQFANELLIVKIVPHDFLCPQVGVCPLRDNDPSDPYRYEITLWTGMRRNAGTKSKVSMIVYGDEHDSEPRSLEYPDRSPFQRGSQDTFLLTTPFSMGTIQYIRIWHDNGGGSWFLSRIMVIDLQTDERYYFICNRWLAVDEEDGQVGKNLANYSSYFSCFPAIVVDVRWARFFVTFFDDPLLHIRFLTL